MIGPEIAVGLAQSPVQGFCPRAGAGGLWVLGLPASCAARDRFRHLQAAHRKGAVLLALPSHQSLSLGAGVAFSRTYRERIVDHLQRLAGLSEWRLDIDYTTRSQDPPDAPRGRDWLRRRAAAHHERRLLAQALRDKADQLFPSFGAAPPIDQFHPSATGLRLSRWILAPRLQEPPAPAAVDWGGVEVRLRLMGPCVPIAHANPEVWND